MTHFNDVGHIYVKGVVTPELCQYFSDILFRMKNQHGLKHEGTVSGHYGESYGGNCDEFEKYLKAITPQISEKLQVKIKPANTYGRIYFNGGRLQKHVDRPGLDYTLSVSLKTNLTNDWPLYFKDKNGKTIALNIKDGDGAMMLGREMEHWRDDLVCSPDQWATKLFLHWSYDG